ncbi:hypothetical protein C2E31_10670, partial [Rhodopirellula baltica]
MTCNLKPIVSTNLPNRVFDFFLLEDRILLSADGLHQGDGDFSGDLEHFDQVVSGFTIEVDESHEVAVLEVETVAVLEQADAGNASQVFDGSEQSDADFVADGQADTDGQGSVAAKTLEVVIVDAGVENADELLAGLREQSSSETEWVVVRLSADQDGIEQITESMANLSGVDAIHILSHSDGSSIQLGNTRLDSQTVNGYAGALASWQSVLDSDADLLIYGCDLASSDAGRELLDSLAALCQCDIAASDDATGHESLGGDWDLEYTLGDVQTQVAIGYHAQSAWFDTLATITVTTFADELDGNTTDISSLQASSGGSGISLREAIIAANNTAGADTIILGDGVYLLDIAGQFDDAGSTGDLDILSDITISGNGASLTSIDASSLSDRIFHVQSGGTLSIDSLTLSGASSGTETGAAAYVQGTLTATDTVISGNTVGNTNGGAISSVGTTTLERVAIINNTSGGLGGGLYVSAGTTTLNNVTVSGNQTAFDGGGIRVANGGTIVNITHSTIADNDASGGSGGGLAVTDATVNVSYSIFADNTSQFNGNDVNGPVVSGGYNIIEHNVGFSGTVGSDILGSDPSLSALTAEGDTFVHTIDETSLAYNAATGSAETLDQTGSTRDANADIGAYEFLPNPSDLQITSTGDGGLTINNDGGDNLYLIADDGSAVFGGRTQFTFETQFATTDTVSDSTLVSYATTANDNEVLFLFESGGPSIHIGGTKVQLTAVNYNDYRDGNPHTFSWTWNNSAGDWSIYVDGALVESGTGLRAGYTIGTGGALTFGQEQDSVGGTFQLSQVFKGTLFNSRVFSDIRSASEISASYGSSLPFNESGLVAEWKFDHLSIDGVLTETVSGNNLTLRTVSGFTASEAILTLAVDENALDGTVVGTVQGIDPEREALIASILASDSTLVYSAETGKFYRAVTSPTNWTTAESTALSTSLNGVNGQLATIHSAGEQEVLAGIASTAAQQLFLGGTDSTSEGDWRWRQSGSNAETFWSGGINGTNVDGSYTNWITGAQPDNSGGSQHYLVIRPTGEWDDEDNSGGGDNGYIIEWDADAVLDAAQPLTYTLLSQTVAGAFTIDSDNGRILVADSSLIDFESNSTHTITVRVTDTDSNTRDESFTIVVNDIQETTTGPSNLSSGVELNSDGGNDAYFIANDGDAILGGLSEFTFESRFQIDDFDSSPTLFSYYSGNDAARLRFDATDHLDFRINGVSVTTANTYSQLFDGDSHHLAISWDNTHGDVQIYIDGRYAETLTGLQAGYTIAAGGELVIGNDQDGANSGYSTDQAFHGAFYDVRIWNDIRTEAEISLNYQQKLDLSPAEAAAAGLVANWQMELNGSNEIVDIVSEGTTNNRLSIGHASGTGFTTSTVTTDLHVYENSSNGTSVGFVTPSQSDPETDVVSDGLFLDSATSTDQFVLTGTFGGWTVTSGDVDLLSTDTWQSLLGGRLVDLNGNTAGSIEQSLSTTVGQQYQVVFSLTGNFTGGDAVKDLRVSANGLSQDYTVDQPANWVWGETNSLETRSFTFTADSATTMLAFASLEASGGAYGPMIGDIRVIEIPDAVTTILNNDSTLQYDAATDKFYRYVSNAQQFSVARANAISSTLNGVSGQLVTIRSGYENDLIQNMVSNNAWIGASDATSEGSWRWLDGSADGDEFWSGNQFGSNIDGKYYNWNGGEPNNTTGSDPNGEQAMEMHKTTGRWNDLPDNGSNTRGYVIEWDASEVFSGYSYSLTDSAGGRFAIDIATGEITVADGAQLEYESATSHNITVQVADAFGNTYSEVFTIGVDDAKGDAQWTVPIAPVGQSVDEDSVLTFSAANGNPVTIDDGSSQAPIVTTTLSVSNGNLTLGSTSGITFLAGTSNGQATLTISGTASDINTALDGLQYAPSANYYGSDSLTVTTGSSAATEADLYARYEFLDGSLDDQSGNGYDGVAVSDPAVFADSDRGDVITLDGDDAISVMNGTASLADTVTIAAWVNLNASQNDAVFLSIGDAFYVTLDVSGGSVGMSVTAGTLTTTTGNAAHQIAGDGWHHVAATFDDVSNQVNLYLDGVLIASVSGSTDVDWAATASQNITIGGQSDGSMAFVGSLDDVRVYDKVLTEAEVVAVMGDQGYDSAAVAVTVNPINDDPTNNGSLPSDILVTIDTPSNVHLSEVDFADVDAGSGNVTVTLTTSTGGQLTASSSGGVTVGGTATARTFTGTITDLNAYFDDVTQIKYQHGTPGTTGNDVDSISVVINDGGNTGSGGGGDVALGSVNVDISPPNQAPVLTPYGPVYNTAEDAPPLAASIATVLGSSVSDADPGAVQGLALYGFTGSGGLLEYSLDGSNWIAVPPVSTTGALLLRASDFFRFTPSTSNGGTMNLDYRAWDQSSGTAGTLADVTVTGGSSAYSVASDHVLVNLTSVNDAPVLDNSGTMTLNSITEDSINNAGQSIASVIASAGGDRITDVDNGAVEGIAITTLTQANGTWQFSTNGGSTWADVGAVSDSSALLLRSSDLIRFQPNGIDGTTADFTFRAWDQTTGSAGTKVNASSTGGTTAFSTATESASILVTAINDDPTNAGSLPTDISVTEDQLSNVDLSLIDLSDVDAGANAITVTLTTSTGGQLSASSGGGVTVGGTSSAMTLSGTVANLNTFLNNASSIQYVHSTANLNGNDADTVNVVVNDGGNTGTGGGGDVDLGTVNIDITAVNDEQVLATNTGTTVSEGSTGNTITTAMLQTTDVDNASSQLVYTLDVVPSNGTLYRNGVALIASDTFTQADIDANLITYSHDGSQSASDAFDFTVDDGIGATTSATFNITVSNVNDAPVASAIEGSTLSYTENAGAVAITSTLSLTDVDDTNLESAVVQVSGNYVNGQDVLGFTNQNGITGSWDSSTGILTLTGTASVANYQTALRSVTYTNNSDAPSTSQRTVTFTVNDGDIASNSQSRTIDVTPVNDAPILVPYAPVYNTSEDAPAFATNIATLLGSTLTDPDSGAQEGIAVFGFSGSGGAIEYSIDGGANWITLPSVSPSSALLLRDSDLVRFVPATDNGGTLLFDYRGWDQTSGSAGSQVDATSTGGTTAFSSASDRVTVNVASVNDEQVLATNTGATVAEGSSANLVTTAMLQTTDVDNSSSQLVYTVSSTPGNGTLYRNGVALSATDTFTQADIDSNLITYTHDGSETLSDAFNFTVDDGVGATSSGTFNWTVTPVNDEQVLATNTGATVAEGSSANLVTTAMLQTTDVDNSSSQLVYTVSSTPGNGTLYRNG